MQKDIKKELSNYKADDVKLTDNHANKFKDLLKQEMHQQQPKKKSYQWLSVAASIVLLLSLAIKFYPSKNIEEDSDLIQNKSNTTTKEITLGNISPEFQTLETYYKNSINLEISQLELNDDNKEIIDGYLLKIAELTKEYKSLTQELNTKGVNDATIDALVRNLQLRLQLLQRLKKQLKQLKNLNKTQNETQII